MLVPLPAPGEYEWHEDQKGDNQGSRHGPYFGPLEAARKTASWWSVVVPSDANFGITVLPNFDGSVT